MHGLQLLGRLPQRADSPPEQQKIEVEHQPESLGQPAGRPGRRFCRKSPRGYVGAGPSACPVRERRPGTSVAACSRFRATCCGRSCSTTSPTSAIRGWYSARSAACCAHRPDRQDAVELRRRHEPCHPTSAASGSKWQRVLVMRFRAVFFDVPLEVCLERRFKRDRQVTDEVMRSMADRLKPPVFKEGFDKITVVRVKATAGAAAGNCRRLSKDRRSKNRSIGSYTGAFDGHPGCGVRKCELHLAGWPSAFKRRLIDNRGQERRPRCWGAAVRARLPLCGWSTSFSAADQPGRVLVGGRDASTVDPIELRRGIGYVIQETGTVPAH